MAEIKATILLASNYYDSLKESNACVWKSKHPFKVDDNKFTIKDIMSSLEQKNARAETFVLKKYMSMRYLTEDMPAIYLLDSYEDEYILSFDFGCYNMFFHYVPLCYEMSKTYSPLTVKKLFTSFRAVIARLQADRTVVTIETKDLTGDSPCFKGILTNFAVNVNRAIKEAVEYCNTLDVVRKTKTGAMMEYPPLNIRVKLLLPEYEHSSIDVIDYNGMDSIELIEDMKELNVTPVVAGTQVNLPPVNTPEEALKVSQCPGTVGRSKATKSKKESSYEQGYMDGYNEARKEIALSLLKRL
jgi:hypothetical protein